jgi:O-antigen/teichoic acid export membrane protein
MWATATLNGAEHGDLASPMRASARYDYRVDARNRTLDAPAVLARDAVEFADPRAHVPHGHTFDMTLPPTLSGEEGSSELSVSAEPAATRFTMASLWRAALDRSSGTIARGAIWGLLTTAGGVVLGMLSQVALARQLDTAGYGVYAYVLAAMNAVSILGRIELDTAAVRFVGAYHATESWGLLRGFLHKSRIWVNAASGSLALIAAVGILIARPWMPAGYTVPLLVGCALLPLASRLQLEAGFLQGLRRIRESQAPFQLLRPAVLCITVLGIGASSFKLNVSVALLLQLLATLAALLVTFRLMATRTPHEVREVPAIDDSREWIHTAGGLLVISLSQLMLSTQTDVLVVNSILGKESTALYSTASQLSALISFAFTALILIVQPQIARLYAQKKLSDLQRLIGQIQLASLVTSLGVFLVLAIGGRWALGWFGKDFRAGYPVMLILGAGQIALATVGAVSGYLLTMTGHQREASRVIGGTALFNLVLTLILTPLIGIQGTALATTIAVVARTVILAVIVRRMVGVSLFALPRLR